MRSIGGYLELDPGNGSSWHTDATAFDLGRHALEAILRARGYSRLHAPRYTCDVLGAAINRSGVELLLYEVDDRLEPLLPMAALQEGDALLCTNYCGLKEDMVDRLARTHKNLIVDNAQAFYAPLPAGADGFVSCRKFFGVADGAYAICDAIKSPPAATASTAERYAHLFTALEQGIESGFPLSQAHERRLDEAPVRCMSRFTRALLSRVDHELVIAARRRNRDRLHAALGATNQLPIDPAAASVPMAYPYLSGAPGLRDRLLAARIYVPRYWPATLAPLSATDGGRLFSEQVLFLPVDQRYGDEDMDRMIAETLS